MELYVEPKWAVRPKERKPHPLKGKHQWTTNDPEKREKVYAALMRGCHKSKNKGKPSHRRIPVSVYDLDGNYITTCPSVIAAADKFGVSSGDISSCTNGRRDRVGQYQFRRAKVVEFMGEKLVKKTPIEPYKRRNRKPNLITN